MSIGVIGESDSADERWEDAGCGVVHTVIEKARSYQHKKFNF